MATETSGGSPSATQPTDVGFKRELGLIGATWASETSIIGSGWLFGALYASQAVGGAAVVAWVIAGVMVIVLALAHAELGAMYPVSGGTARFPHFAFGSVAGIGFGFFSYVQAVTIAPIECFAFMQYAAYFWPSIYDSTTRNVTGVGFVLTIVLMAVFVAVNFLAMRIFARVNNVITWWKVAIPVLTIIVLLTHSTAATSRPAAASCRAGSRPCSPRCLPRASSSPTPASSSATSWPGRSRTRDATCRGRSSTPS